MTGPSTAPRSEPDAREPYGRIVNETRRAFAAERVEIDDEGRRREFRIPEWEQRLPSQRELDMRIGAAVEAAVLERLRAVIPPEQFRAMADWFDTDDEFKMSMFPETWPAGSRGHETQDDLRKFADLLEGSARPGSASPGAGEVQLPFLEAT
jgi:hypothetical protein